MDAFCSLVQRSTPLYNHLLFNVAFKVDRSVMNQMGNKVPDQEFDHSESSATAYVNEDTVDDDDNFIIHHDDKIPPIPTLSIGCSIRYMQDDHLEVGKFVGVYLSNTF